MEWLKAHVHDKVLAGLLAAVPVYVVIRGALMLEQLTEPLAKPFGLNFPGLGFLLAVLGVYVLGLLVTSFFGRFALRRADRMLRRLPGVGGLYASWRDVVAVRPGHGNPFHQVVLVGNLATGAQLGFTSGRPIPSDPHNICVFLPGIPNLLNGRLVVVQRDSCLLLPLSVEEAIKFLVSTGNYLPTGLHGTIADAGPPPVTPMPSVPPMPSGTAKAS